MKSKKSKLFKSFLTLFLIISVAQIHGQTPEMPGWHSQTPLQMSKTQCFNTAKNALNSVGLTIQSTLDGWSVHGTNYNVRAGISCISCGNGVHVSVVVATTHGYYKANSLRDRIRDYMLIGLDNSGGTPEQCSYNLEGEWRSIQAAKNWDKRGYFINQNGNEVTLRYTGDGTSATGTCSGNVINLTGGDWGTGTGKISDGGKRIDFDSDGSYWIKL